MAMPTLLHSRKLSILKTQLLNRICNTIIRHSPYSSASTLAHLFSNQTTTAAAAASTTKLANADRVNKSLQNSKPEPSSPSSSNRILKARSMARLINSKPWSPYLETSLSSLSPVSQTTIIHTLHLINSPANALHFFNWAEKSGFKLPAHSYSVLLQHLCKARNLNSARNFLFSIPKRSKGEVQLTDKHFNALILSYGKTGLFQESLKVFKTMKSIGISPSVFTFNILFSILLKRGRTGMAYELYDEMLMTFGVKPDLYTFNILIRGFCKNKMVDKGFRFFKEMEGFKCEADVITYNTIIDGLCKDGKVNVARNVVNGMVKKGSNLSPNVVSYTTLIRGYCGKLEIDEALEVYEEMVSRGITPNEVTYNTLILGLCEAHKLDKVKVILEGSGGFVPDTCTFNTLMNAHCIAGYLGEAMKIFENMLELKVQPDSATYSMLIRSLCQGGDFERAETLFDELSDKEILLREGGCKPLVAAYNPIFEYLCKSGKTRKAEKVFRQLMREGTQDALAFKTLIMGHFKEDSFEAGHKLLVLMLRRNFIPDVEIYERLIDGLLQKGEPILAHDALEKMLKNSHLPKTSTFQVILAELLRKGFASESASLLMLMLDKTIRPTISLSTDTIRGLFKRGLHERGFEIFRRLYENGYMVNMDELIKFLCQERKLLEAYELLLVSLKKEQSIDLNISSMVLTGLCEVHRVSEAFNLYYELLEKDDQQPLGGLEDLRIALQAEGRFKEAEFVAKRMLNEL